MGKGDGEQDDGLILNQLNDLRDLINKANTNGIEGYDSLIRQSADTLCDLFNSAAKDLAELKTTFEATSSRMWMRSTASSPRFRS